MHHNSITRMHVQKHTHTKGKRAKYLWKISSTTTATVILEMLAIRRTPKTIRNGIPVMAWVEYRTLVKVHF